MARYGYVELSAEEAFNEVDTNGDGVITVLKYKRHSWRKSIFPPELGLLSQLRVIEFVETAFEPLLVEVLPLQTPDSLSTLEELILVDSELVGSIPSTLGLLNSLTHLDLSQNKLTGQIPSELGLLSNLTSLILPSNRLSGSIPTEIGNLSSLTILELQGNPEMEPNLPAALCSQNQSAEKSFITDWCASFEECCDPP